MFWNNNFLLLLVTLSCTIGSSSKVIRKLHSEDEDKGPFEAKQNGNGIRGKMKKWRLVGEYVFKDEIPCIYGDFFDVSGTQKLGTFEDCGSNFKPRPNNVTKFRKRVNFTTNHGDEVVITCRATANPRDNLPKPYNYRERCKQKRNGIKEPSDAGGSVSMYGNVGEGANASVMVFDFNYTIRPKKFLYCGKKAKYCVPTSDTPSGLDSTIETVYRQRELNCRYEPCIGDCSLENENSFNFGDRVLCADD